MQVNANIKIVELKDINNYFPSLAWLGADKLGSLGQIMAEGYGLIIRRDAKCKPTSVKGSKKVIYIANSSVKIEDWVVIQKISKPFEDCPTIEVGLYCAQNLVSQPTQKILVIGAGIIIDDILVCADTFRTPTEFIKQVTNEFSFNKDLARYFEILKKETYDWAGINFVKDRVKTEKGSRQTFKNYLVKAAMRQRKPMSIEQFVNKLDYAFSNIIVETNGDTPTPSTGGVDETTESVQAKSVADIL